MKILLENFERRKKLCMIKSNPIHSIGFIFVYGGFDPGSERTLAVCLKHASRTAAGHVAIYGAGEWRTGE